MSEKPVAMFVHGMFMTPASWAEWRGRFTDRGYDTVAPRWPGRDGTPSELRAKPDPVLNTLTLEQVIDVYREALSELAGRRVFLIGHSMGGLVAQILLAEGLAEAAVAIDAAPPHGVQALSWSFLRSNFPVLLPFSSPVNLSLGQFTYAWAHTLPAEEAKRIYETFVVPESRLVGKGPTTKVAAIDFSRERGPLLLIAGSDDHIIPANVVEATFAAQSKGQSVTEIKHFEGRVHWIVGQAGWKEVADAAATWLHDVGGSPVA